MSRMVFHGTGLSGAQCLPPLLIGTRQPAVPIPWGTGSWPMLAVIQAWDAATPIRRSAAFQIIPYGLNGMREARFQGPRGLPQPASLLGDDLGPQGVRVREAKADEALRTEPARPVLMVALLQQACRRPRNQQRLTTGLWASTGVEVHLIRRRPAYISTCWKLRRSVGNSRRCMSVFSIASQGGLHGSVTN